MLTEFSNGCGERAVVVVECCCMINYVDVAQHYHLHLQITEPTASVPVWAVVFTNLIGN